MKRGVKPILIVAVMALNATAILHSNRRERTQGKPVVARPLRVQLNEIPFVLLPNLVKA